MNQLIRIIFTAAIITSIAACGNRNSSSNKAADSATDEVSLLDKDFELFQHPTKEMLFGHWVCEEDGVRDELVFSDEGCLRKYGDRQYQLAFEIITCNENWRSDFIKGADCISIYDPDPDALDGELFVMDVTKQIIEVYDYELHSRYVKISD